MFKKLNLLIVYLALAQMCFAQEFAFDKKFGPNQLKEDWGILLSDLRAAHPGLYEYTTPNELDSLATVFEGNLTDSLTQEQFHVRIRKFLSVIGCGHTSAKPSKLWYSTLRGKGKLIPIHIYLQNDQFYIRRVLDKSYDSLVGMQIHSFDGVSASEVLAELRSIVGRDGVGEALVNRNIEKLFQTYYLFLTGLKDSYELELSKPDGVVVAVTLSGKAAKHYSVGQTHDLIEVHKLNYAKFGFTDSSRKVAVMDLNRFGTKGYRKFYKKSFKKLNDSGAEALIIDLRGNGGGYFPNGNQLLRYLMKEKFTMDFDRQRKQGKRSKYIKTDVPGKLTRFIFTTIPDRNKEDPDRNYQVRFKPIKKNQFNGQVYIITDGWTFSTSSFVASKLKNSGNAVTVGSETGGGEMAFNAVLKWNLSLPNSGVRVVLPMYHVDIQPDMDDAGRGVMPTIPVEYENIQQRTGGIDLEMEKILELLKAN